MFDFLQGSSFDRTSLEVAVEAQEVASLVRFNSYKAVGCRRRQSRDRK